jgi:hypothetical protein
VDEGFECNKCKVIVYCSSHCKCCRLQGLDRNPQVVTLELSCSRAASQTKHNVFQRVMKVYVRHLPQDSGSVSSITARMVLQWFRKIRASMSLVLLPHRLASAHIFERKHVVGMTFVHSSRFLFIVRKLFRSSLSRFGCTLSIHGTLVRTTNRSTVLQGSHCKIGIQL